MSWSEFTKSNIGHFKNQVTLGNTNPLANELRKEREKIIEFIKQTKINYLLEPVTEIELAVTENKIAEIADVAWVDTKMLDKDLVNHDKVFKISWNTPGEENYSDIVNVIFIKTTNQLIQKIVKRIKYLIYIGEYLKIKSANTHKKFKIYLVLSNLKKYFPNKNKKINITNVNGGYTDFNDNYVFVWRYEEFEKVTLHEIIHFLDMDMRNHHVENKFKINGPSSFYEAITDFWAIYYHLIYLSMLTKESISKLLELEFAFIENQAMALNSHFQLGDWKEKSNIKINQTTPALSYYILKYLMFKYFVENKMGEIKDLNKLIETVLNIGFIQKPFVKLESSRMSLLQLD